MSSSYEQLKERLAKIAAVNKASAVLAWDQSTYMPAGGVQDRGEQLAVRGRVTVVVAPIEAPGAAPAGVIWTVWRSK